MMAFTDFGIDTLIEAIKEHRKQAQSNPKPDHLRPTPDAYRVTAKRGSYIVNQASFASRQAWPQGSGKSRVHARTSFSTFTHPPRAIPTIFPAMSARLRGETGPNRDRAWTTR